MQFVRKGKYLTFEELCDAFPLRPIKDAKQYSKALEFASEVETNLSAHPFQDDWIDYLGTLALLIGQADYELHEWMPPRPEFGQNGLLTADSRRDLIVHIRTRQQLPPIDVKRPMFWQIACYRGEVMRFKGLIEARRGTVDSHSRGFTLRVKRWSVVLGNELCRILARSDGEKGVRSLAKSFEAVIRDEAMWKGNSPTSCAPYDRPVARYCLEQISDGRLPLKKGMREFVLSELKIEYRSEFDNKAFNTSIKKLGLGNLVNP